MLMIRSQNKKDIIPFDMLNIYIHKENMNDYTVCATGFYNLSDCNTIILGRYTTEELAIGVLDDICKEYGKLNTTYSSYHTGMYAYVRNGIYQMP